MNQTFFFSVTLGLVVAGFYLAYTPDNFQKDWAQREAFLELRRREAAGLPPIDFNYADPANIELPSDEELGDMEIII
jgi:NADH dehydrogenase (ubiquinone) 1 beta subcomplex subunit 11